MTESDWKIFKKIKTQALDLYCKNSLNEIQQVLNNTEKTHHERNGQIYELVLNRDKLLASIFDGHSRSNAWLQLTLMRRHNLINQTLLLKMSEDFQEQTKPVTYN